MLQESQFSPGIPHNVEFESQDNQEESKALDSISFAEQLANQMASFSLNKSKSTNSEA
jgi:hypothetical protein